MPPYFWKNWMSGWIWTNPYLIIILILATTHISVENKLVQKVQLRCIDKSFLLGAGILLE